MSPASVDDPEPRLIYCFVDVEEALVLQNTQRDKAERSHSEVSPVSDLFSEPMLHTVDQPDGFDCVVVPWVGLAYVMPPWFITVLKRSTTASWLGMNPFLSSSL